MLRKIAHVAPKLVHGISSAQQLAAMIQPTGMRNGDPGKHSYQRALPRAIGADQRGDAAVQLKVYGTEPPAASITELDLTSLYQRKVVEHESGRRTTSGVVGVDEALSGRAGRFPDRNSTAGPEVETKF